MPDKGTVGDLFRIACFLFVLGGVPLDNEEFNFVAAANTDSKVSITRNSSSMLNLRLVSKVDVASLLEKYIIMEA